MYMVPLELNQISRIDGLTLWDFEHVPIANIPLIHQFREQKELLLRAKPATICAKLATEFTVTEKNLQSQKRIYGFEKKKKKYFAIIFSRTQINIYIIF